MKKIQYLTYYVSSRYFVNSIYTIHVKLAAGVTPIRVIVHTGRNVVPEIRWTKKNQYEIVEEVLEFLFRIDHSLEGIVR
jgi:hypothetical protein